MNEATRQSRRAKEAALAAERAGLATVPPRMDGTKAPYPQSWKQFQSARPSRPQIEKWYRNGLTGVGVLAGRVSGDLECLDFDDHEAWERFKELAEATGLGPLLHRMCDGYSERSPNGFHLLYRCKELGGSFKLAQAADNKTLIETRGQGGYVITAPTSGPVNPAGDYVSIAGGFDSIVRITPEERCELHNLARSFHEAPKPEHRPQEDVTPGERVGEGRPGDEYNASTTWHEVMEPPGWVCLFSRGDTDYWRRPGKRTGVSATTNHNGSGRLWVFSTSTPFEAGRSYDKFGAYAVLNHGGGYGPWDSHRTVGTSRDAGSARAPW
jgi:putative DNA primase/helicase